MAEETLKRTPPCSREAEQSVIGAMILDQDAVVTAAELLTKEDFYYKEYAALFEAICELYNEGRSVDVVTLQNRLRDKAVPEEVSS